MPKILFLTTHNLASNPRLVKEIRLALENNFRVEIICFIFRNWSYNINEQLLRDFRKEGVIIHTIEAGKEIFGKWLISFANEKIARFAGRVINFSSKVLSNAISRRSYLLVNALKNASSPQWVIGHNPGALYATYLAGKKFECKTGFDTEDYHPGEGNNFYLQVLSKKLMIKILPQLNYVSFAAPLILNQVQNDIGKSFPHWFTVLNYFPAAEFIKPENKNEGPVKLVWFSQNINEGRGLELMLPALKLARGKIELHLIGNVDIFFKKQYLDGCSNIILHGPLSQLLLHKQLSLFDIGLALEPAKDKNNDLLISNKLLAYLQAGLYVVVTNTSAQKSFMDKFPFVGILIDYKKNNSKNTIDFIISNIDNIRSSRIQRYYKFERQNWKNESGKLLTAWLQK